MILLDENIASSQRRFLQRANVRFSQIGYEDSRKGIQDDEIISLLNQRAHVTLFTRDDDFYQSRFCHSNYCIVLLDVPGSQAAEFIRRLLKHKSFRTQAKRMGHVVRVNQKHIYLRRIHKNGEEIVD